MEKVKPHKHGWLSTLLFTVIALAVAGALILSYVSVIVNPAKAWQFTLLGLLFIPLAILTLLLFFWSIHRRSSLTGFLLLALLPSVFLIGKYYQFKGPGEPEREPTLKMVTYNVGLFAHGGKEDRMEVADSVAAFLRGTKADIICLQEFYLPNSVDLDGWLHRQFPGYHADYYVLTGEKGHAGNVTLSRRNVLYKGKLDFDKSTNLALHTDIQLDSTVLRFYNCHLESYNLSVDRIDKAASRSSEVVETTGRKMRHSITLRADQVETVLRDVENCPVRSVILGDFNDNPLSYTVHRLSRGRYDTFEKAGKGFGATFRSLWPSLRIDYILYPRDLEAVSYEVRKVRYSDHYPIIATYYEKR